MRASWNRVDLTRVAELRALVDAARATPTGNALMDELAKRPTNLRIHADADWDADDALRGTHGVFAGSQNTMHLPQRTLVQHDSDDARTDLLTFVHEGVHRTQLPVHLPGAASAARSILVDPWRMAAAAAGGAVDAARAGASPVRGARDGAVRSALHAEVEAFDVEQRMAADLARNAGRAAPVLKSPDELAALIRPDYTDQTRRQILAGIAALGMQGGLAVGGASQLRARRT